MRNLYLVDHARRFKVVCIAKNACTTLKRIVLRDDYPEAVDRVQGKEELHEFFGYCANGRSLLRLYSWRGYNYLRFAVYRDPVERALSFYANKVLPTQTDSQLIRRLGLCGCSIDRYLDFLEVELRRSPASRIDMHIRPQARYYIPRRHVDVVVELADLSDFLATQFGFFGAPHENSTAQYKPLIAPLTPAQRTRLQQLYAEDYDLAHTAGQFFWPNPYRSIGRRSAA